MANIDVENRIREVRKTLNLKQVEFGIRLGVTVGVISNIELHRNQGDICNSPLIDLVCSTFNVNEHWLRTGEGKMFATPDGSVEDYLIHLQQEHRLSDIDMKILRMYINMSPQERQNLIDIIDKLIEARNS